MPLRKTTDHDDGADHHAPPAKPFPPEAYKYDAELNQETVKRIQEQADKVLDKEEWVVIDGVEKR